MKKKIMAMILGITVSLQGVCLSTVSVGATPSVTTTAALSGDDMSKYTYATSSVKPSSTTTTISTTAPVEVQKPLISVKDILDLSEKGDALTWSDFEKYDYTDIGDGLYIWELNVEYNDTKLMVGGESLDEKPIYIKYVVSDGKEIDIRENDITQWIYDYAPIPTEPTAPITTTTTTANTTITVETKKPLISVKDILGLSEKGDALTWSDFEKYEYTDIGSGLYIWELNVEYNDTKLMVGGESLDEKPIYIKYVVGDGKEIDIRENDITQWIYDYAPIPTEPAAPITTTTTAVNTTITVETKKPLISVKDMLDLSEKGDALTWSDFEKYEYTDIGSGLCIWEFSIENSGAKLIIDGESLDKKPTHIKYVIGNGAEVDIRKSDMTQLFYDSALDTVSADLNNDGIFNIADVVKLQQFLSNKKAIGEKQLFYADINGDGEVNVFDLCLMKRNLLKT